jgi:hypothetical protein
MGGLAGAGGLVVTSAATAQQPADPSTPASIAPQPTSDPFSDPAPVSGILPGLAVSAGLEGPRSESGIGALMPWGGRLWFVTYTAHTARTGSGTGLFFVDEAMRLHRHEASVVGTYANRLVHAPSSQMMIGPHLVDAKNQVRTVDELARYRLTATLTHPADPERKLLVLGMEGHLWELDVASLAVTQLFDLRKELALPEGLWPHFKGGFTAGSRVIVANNTYDERDQTGDRPPGGRLAQWDGKGPWELLESTAFNEVTGRPGADHAQAIAIGWDKASVILRILNRDSWTRYRLPRASHAFDHGWYTEWPRAREVETERLLLDAHGLFYELSPLAYGGRVWGIRPISQHLRMIPDFCSWKGMLVLAGDQATAVGGNLWVGEPQANLWFGATDDLWRFGPPQGWGGPWWKSPVEAKSPSDPFLMTGFVHKVLHLSNDGPRGTAVDVEVDFLGDGSWHPYARLDLDAGGYAHHEFPSGFSAHWVRLVPGAATTLTAQFAYT